MPPNPQKNDRIQDTPGGQVQVHIAQAQDPAGKYMSTLSEFPQGEPGQDEEQGPARLAPAGHRPVHGRDAGELA